MNYVQKIFYFHISNAWVGMLGFIVAAVAGIVYLVTKDLKWDIVELAAVEISLVFFFIAIVSGSIWAKPSWGTYWTWDARLTTAAILEMIYLAYLLLRQGIEDPERRARFSAVYTLIGAVSVPITFLSIRIWQTIHPAVIGGSSEFNGQLWHDTADAIYDVLLPDHFLGHFYNPALVPRPAGAVWPSRSISLSLRSCNRGAL